MWNSWHFKHVALLLGLFVITVAYNGCSDSMEFDFASDFNELGRFSEGAISGPRLIINNGAEYTQDTRVNLTLDPGSSADSMFISTAADCSLGVWEPYGQNKIWTLPARNQRVAVYVKYRWQDFPETDCVKGEIVHDDIPPQVDFAQGVGSLWVRDRNLKVSFLASDSGSGVAQVECDAYSSGRFAKCGETVNYFNLEENRNYPLIVKATDRAGNVSRPQPLNWRTDFTAPTLAFTLTPAALTADPAPTFHFLGHDLGSGVQSYECQLDAAPIDSPCVSPLTFHGLANGSHSLLVRAVDNVGHRSAPLSFTWKQDRRAATLQWTQTPRAVENSGQATFRFGLMAGAPIVSYQCRVDSGAYQSCGSAFTVANLADGRHSISVVGLSPLGRRSAALTYSWLVDSQAPTMAIVGRPASVTNSSLARLSFVAQDVGAGVREIRCRMDGLAFTVCPNSKSFSYLRSGHHTIEAKAIDLAGNQSSIQRYQWIQDSEEPRVQISGRPTHPTSSDVARFELTASDSGTGLASLQCGIDGAESVACPNSVSWSNLADGQHSFSVRAIDGAGNVSAPASYTWLVDTQGPSLGFVFQPQAVEFVGNRPQIRFIADDGNGAGVGFQPSCRFNNAPYNCQSDNPYFLPALEEGSYDFSVTVRDVVGNRTTRTVHWDVQSRVVHQQTSFAVGAQRPVDILFVIDNSGSMDGKRENLAERIQGLLSKIDNLDWQIAVTSTDATGLSDADYKKGRLVDFNGDGLHILTSDMDQEVAQRLFANKVRVQSRANPHGIPGDGNGDERGILATALVVERALDPDEVEENAPNRAFIRQGADFVVVILSDENEGSHGRGENVVYQPRELLTQFNSSYQNQKNLTWHSIIVQSGDRPCLNSGGGVSIYGSLYEELSRLTKGVVGSVCSPHYTESLKNIGQSVRELSKTVALQCSPLDRDGDGLGDISMTVQANGLGPYQVFNADYRVQGLKVAFDDFLPAGNFLFDYDCAE